MPTPPPDANGRLSGTAPAAARRLILASTSRYRRELLGRLGLPFEALPPAVDESPLPGEAPAEGAVRLAGAKAAAVAAQHPEAVVIGSDQVADLDGQWLGKPGTVERARAQLARMSGRTLVFQTAVAVVCHRLALAETRLAPVRVRVRTLTAAEIDRYLAREDALDCAGSARSEGLGIALLEAVESDDPTALIGLPLIRTCALLRRAGLDPLGF
jgi:septum formation protein